MTSAEAVAASLSYPIKVLSPFGRELLGTLVVPDSLWIRDSIRIRRYLASLSFLLFSKCFLMLMAFRMRQWMSSGICGAQPE